MKRWILNGSVLAMLLGAIAVGAAFTNALHVASNGTARASLFRDLLLGFFSSAAGAVGGAYASQRIADRAALRKNLLEEMRATNATHTQATKLFSTSINLHDQFSRGLYETFEAQRQQYIEGKPPSGDPRLQLVSCAPPVLAADALRDQVLAKLDSGARSQAIVMILAQSARDLIDSLEQRNEWTRNFGVHFPVVSIESLNLYFGVEQSSVKLDETNRNLIRNIYQTTRDCIWFSYTLCELLTAHGSRLVRKWDNEFGVEGRPAIRKAVVADGVRAKIPKDSEYPTWLADSFPPE